MAKKTLVRDQDKFMLRLPDGMRDRIKAKADRAGMSMNEAIVWCLDQYFPAPKNLETKINELVEMVAILKGDDTNKAIGDLIAEIHDALIDIHSDKLDAPVDFKKSVEKKFTQWQEWEAEQMNNDAENPFDDSLYSDADPFDLDRK